MTSECTDPPEKIFFTKVGKNIIPNSQRMSPDDVEYLRKDKHIAYLADYRAAYEGSCDQIDSYKAEVAQMWAALNLIAYADEVVDTLRAELHIMKTAGIIEVAVRNPSVSEYMAHWEGRSEKAEARVVELRAEVVRLRDALAHGKTEQ